MITNELNTGLVNAVREKLPSKENLANTLMDILYIGKEAIYRRLRGEVPFTLAEAAVISRKLGISLDKMIGVSFQNNAVFDMNIVDSSQPLETYYSILEKQVELFRKVKEEENSEIGTSSNIIPLTLSLNYERARPSIFSTRTPASRNRSRKSTVQRSLGDMIYLLSTTSSSPLSRSRTV